MKVRLTQPGFQKYTGQMGVVFFQDGLSTDHVAERDAIRMAAVMNCEWENGSNLSPSQHVINTLKNSAPVLKTAEVVVDEVTPPTESEQPPTETLKWTREELEALADAQGIQGLRQIADPAGIKGRSITEMIEAIVNAGLPKSE